MIDACLIAIPALECFEEDPGGAIVLSRYNCKQLGIDGSSFSASNLTAILGLGVDSELVVNTRTGDLHHGCGPDHANPTGLCDLMSL